MAKPVLGILTLYLNDAGVLEERSIYERMTVIGQKLGLQVFVFTPKDVHYKSNRIYALYYNTDSKLWTRKWTSFPQLIFDRCRIQRSQRYEQLLKFRSHCNKQLFLNRPLRNKWTIHNTLAKDSRFHKHLPKTRYIERAQDMLDMLRTYSVIYLKPINGTGGRGILRIEKRPNGLLFVQGRDQSRKIIRPQQLTTDRLGAFLASWKLSSQRYIAQQGIQLKLNNGRVHDYRMLVQKNGNGKWAVTGCAGRIGAAGSITSNLHGGGRAAKMDALLKQWIRDEDKMAKIKAEVERFGVEAAAYLEECYDSLCELAFDIAIDRSGHIWMLEVNPKPAREVFMRAGEVEVYHNAIAKPLEYALWKYKQKQTAIAAANQPTRENHE